MSSLIKDVGAIAGLASFLGLALLVLLYFAQARDIRRLRENASLLVEGGSEDGETVTPAERTATAVAAKEPERAAAAAAATAPNEAEVTALAYLARTPRVYRGFGAFKALRRFLSSASGISRLSCRFSASIVIESPFLTSASGPPPYASGVI